MHTSTPEHRTHLEEHQLPSVLSSDQGTLAVGNKTDQTLQLKHAQRVNFRLHRHLIPGVNYMTLLSFV